MNDVSVERLDDAHTAMGSFSLFKLSMLIVKGAVQLSFNGPVVVRGIFTQILHGDKTAVIVSLYIHIRL